MVGMSACQGARGTKATVGRRGGGEGETYVRDEGGPGGGGGRWRGEGGNAAAAAAAVAASAPLRVTLEGAHWRTLAQTTGAPVHLNLSLSKSRVGTVSHVGLRAT